LFFKWTIWKIKKLNIFSIFVSVITTNHTAIIVGFTHFKLLFLNRYKQNKLNAHSIGRCYLIFIIYKYCHI